MNYYGSASYRFIPNLFRRQLLCVSIIMILIVLNFNFTNSAYGNELSSQETSFSESIDHLYPGSKYHSSKTKQIYAQSNDDECIICYLFGRVCFDRLYFSEKKRFVTDFFLLLINPELSV